MSGSRQRDQPDSCRNSRRQVLYQLIRVVRIRVTPNDASGDGLHIPSQADVPPVWWAKVVVVVERQHAFDIRRFQVLCNLTLIGGVPVNLDDDGSVLWLAGLIRVVRDGVLR